MSSALAGEHTHTIVGYSLIKGIGDGEPIASERFTVGGHEWVSGRGALHSLRPCRFLGPMPWWAAGGDRCVKVEDWCLCSCIQGFRLCRRFRVPARSNPSKCTTNELAPRSRKR